MIFFLSSSQVLVAKTLKTGFNGSGFNAFPKLNIKLLVGVGGAPVIPIKILPQTTIVKYSLKRYKFRKIKIRIALLTKILYNARYHCGDAVIKYFVTDNVAISL